MTNLAPLPSREILRLTNAQLENEIQYCRALLNWSLKSDYNRETEYAYLKALERERFRRFALAQSIYYYSGFAALIGITLFLLAAFTIF